MRVAIAGAGNVGRSIATELVANGHQVLLIDSDVRMQTAHDVPGANWYIGDACELQNLEVAGLEAYDVSIAATGDDKVNLVHSLLAKTEFGVPRTVGRVNNPHNEWMFDAMWGVDVAVSTPRIMSALVEEAVSTGELVSLLTFDATDTDLSEIRITSDSPQLQRQIGDLQLPADVVLVAVIRKGAPAAPHHDMVLTTGDQLLFLVGHQSGSALAEMFEG